MISRLRRVIESGVLLLLICWGSARAASDLLSERTVLEEKVGEIVRPFLNESPGNEHQETNTSGGDSKADDAKPKAVAPNGRAWAIVVGVVSKQGRHVYGYGRLAADSQVRPDARTLFEIGSVTKTFTALLLADLVEQGKARLDDPVRLYLPDSVKLPKRGDKEITLAHLATHTSALPRIPRSIALKSLISNNPYVGYDAEDLYATLSGLELDRDPGERYAYSNLAFGLLGHVLSRQAGVSYEQLVVEKVCAPLGLRNTRINLSGDLRPRFAKPYNASGTSSSTWEFEALAGAGALRSTADDMLTYLEANMGLKECKLLPAMRRCHQTRHPTENKIQSICLGWHDQKMAGQGRFVFHGGGTGGYSSLVGFVEQNGRPTCGLVVLSNAAPAATGGSAANDVTVQLLGLLSRDSK